MEKNTHFARTKIIGTVGPASVAPDILVGMIEAGLDVVRLNCSHLNSEELAAMIDAVREASLTRSEPVALLADLGGPKIRLASLPSDISVSQGDEIVLTADPEYEGGEKLLVDYPHLAKDVEPGNRILIDDGLIQLEVSAVSPPDIRCRVLNDGVLKSRKGINLPGTKIGISCLTDKDKRDIDVLVDRPIDYIALSFVRSRNDIRELRALLEAKNRPIPIVAKIEKPEAVEDLDGIIEEADLVMVARGDLGVEMPSQDVPLLQKRIISECNRHNTPVITATQMLESMITNPRPTRAEASDVANAVLDGTDAVMLSGETSVGRYPVDAVAIMDKIVRTAETHRNEGSFPPRRRRTTLPFEESICHSACMMAEENGAKAIICLTLSGGTALLLSKFRSRVPIIAYTESLEVVRFLNIVWGVQGELIDEVGDTDTTLERARMLAMERGYITTGDTVVYTAGIPLVESPHTNMIKIQKV